ncbi:carbon-nitrogen hydrolase family protein [Aurantiacibacter gangjinensis]|uniref:Carbon-nitrogen hydrolase n=1 Tax=Aurantiacibacter gangjinensis TaxID=502682 RepID=A0A0G9MPP6_9SPHN|nr:carbon-nitrogen hydrolase family protein [Aurantiacibacter gangjinensis]APE28480.1 Nitrilase [Aurantiacibacter gangjinensis]KLE32686.1 carbon-nitrogen hydrolase [Aurantiacibacter gangjinensis]
MTKLNVAICQAAPVPLAVSDGIDKAVRLATEAVEGGAQLVAFGETFLGGYPLWLDEAPGAALWDHPGTRAMHRILLEQAVVPGDERLLPLQELCDRTGAVISIGAHERVRQSLYNNQMTFRPGLPVLDHRKLVPTHGERLIWMRGDGSTLGVHQAVWGSVGSLICWEHWMPLARAAMHNLGESVHVACWPTVRESYAIASRHYAIEGRCFVLAAGLVQTKADVFDGLERLGENSGAAKELVEAIEADVLNRGGSLIAAPDASVIAQAGEDEETLLAELDLSARDEGLTSLDTDGHYSRPDVFELSVDTRAKDGVRWDIA